MVRSLLLMTLFILSLFADNSEQISLIEANITQTQTAKSTLNLDLQRYDLSRKMTQDIYNIGYGKYKDIHIKAQEYKQSAMEFQSNLDLLRVTYKDFFIAQEAYQHAWRVHDYDRMLTEYRHMWKYMNGYVKRVPNYTTTDIDITYLEVRRWTMNVAGKWMIRTLHTTVQMVNFVKKVFVWKDGIKDVVDATNEGLKTALAYAKEQGIDTIEEALLEDLKERGASASQTLSDTLELAAAVSDPLGAFEGELKKMVDRIAKVDNLGFKSKEVALKETTKLLIQSQELYTVTKADADAIIATLAPIKSKLAEIDANMEKLRNDIRLLDKKISDYTVQIAQLTTVKIKEKFIEDVTVDAKMTSWAFADISFGIYGADPLILSSDNLTNGLTGYPRYRNLYFYSWVFGIGSTWCCTRYSDEEPEECTSKISYTTHMNSYVDPDSSLFTLNGAGLTFDKAISRITAIESAKQELFFTSQKGFDEWSKSEHLCTEDNNYTSYDSFSTKIIETGKRDYISYATEKAFLLPDALNQMSLQDINSTDFTIFDNEFDLPAIGYKIAYKLTFDDEIHMVTPDHIKVDSSTLKEQPNGIKTGQISLSAYMDSDDGEKVKVASVTLHSQELNATVMFTDFDGNETNQTNGNIPFNKPIDFELQFSEGKVALDTSLMQVEWNFNGERVIGSYKHTLTLDDYNLIGKYFPVSYEIFYTATNGMKRTIKRGEYNQLYVAAAIDGFKAKFEDTNLIVDGFQNIFFLEGTRPPAQIVDLYATYKAQEFPFPDAGIYILPTIFDTTYISGGVNNLEESRDNIYAANKIFFSPKDGIASAGGSLALYTGSVKDQSEDTNDTILIYEHAHIDITPILEDEDFEHYLIAGFHFNVIKFRIDEHNLTRKLMLRINGPTDMSHFTVKWNGGSTTTFRKVDGIFESGIIHNSAITTVELINPYGATVGPNPIDYVEYRKDHYSYLNPQNIYERNLMMARTQRHSFEFGKFRTVTESVQTRGSKDSVDHHIEISSVLAEPIVTRINEWIPVPIENVKLSFNSLGFYIGENILRDYKLIKDPEFGSLKFQNNRVYYTPNSGFVGVDNFQFQLGGDIIEPLSSDNPSTVDSRILSVNIELNSTQPVARFKEVVLSAEELYSAFYRSEVRLTFNDELVITRQTTNAPLKVESVDTLQNTVSYKNYVSWPLEKDSGELNSDIELSFTSYDNDYIPEHIFTLESEEEIFFSTAYLRSLFQEEGNHLVSSLKFTELPYSSYTPSTGEHENIVTISHKGVEILEGDVIASADLQGLNGIADMTYRTSEGSSSLFRIVGFVNGNEVEKDIRFITKGLNPDKPIYFASSEFERPDDENWKLSMRVNREGTGYLVITQSIHTQKQEIIDVAKGLVSSSGMRSAKIFSLSTSETKKEGTLQEDGKTYRLYVVAEDNAGNITEIFYRDIRPSNCAQVITCAYKFETGEEYCFATPCDVPDSWIVGSAPDFDKDGKNDILDEDDDNDGMPDVYEDSYGLDSYDPLDAENDEDGDRATNLEEYEAGTDPLDAKEFPERTGLNPSIVFYLLN